MKLTEIENKPGIYVALRFDLVSCKKLSKWVEGLGIKAIPADEMHATVLTTPELSYDDYKATENLNVTVDLTKAEFDIFPMRTTDGKAFVLVLNSDWIQDLRKNIMKEHNIEKTKDPEPFKPHLSLSYEWDDELDVDSLKLPIDKITIISEYKEHLKD